MTNLLGVVQSFNLGRELKTETPSLDRTWETTCKKCRKKTYLIYRGIQRDENGRLALYLLNCSRCNDTLAYEIDDPEIPNNIISCAMEELLVLRR